MKSLTLIGAGRLGKTISKLFADHELFVIKDVVDVSLSLAKEAVDFIGQGRAVETFDFLEDADCFLIAVPDDSIAECAATLAAATDLSGKVLFHCSGALSASVLGEGDFLTASVHPVKSFADPELAVKDFAGTWCGVEGDDEALALLQPLFEKAGAKCFNVESEFKRLYHAGAVFASNFFPLIVESALQCYIKAGIERKKAMQIIEPICRLTMENIFKLGPQQAVTGPVARGDIAAVEAQHESLLENLPHLAPLYVSLSDNLAKMVEKG